MTTTTVHKGKTWTTALKCSERNPDNQRFPSSSSCRFNALTTSQCSFLYLFYSTETCNSVKHGTSFAIIIIKSDAKCKWWLCLNLRSPVFGRRRRRRPLSWRQQSQNQEQEGQIFLINSFQVRFEAGISHKSARLLLPSSGSYFYAIQRLRVSNAGAKIRHARSIGSICATDGA